MARRELVFRVFVSSTFDDLIAERNVLQERVFPKLHAYCQQNGGQFQAVDLRWGVSEEAVREYLTKHIVFELGPRDYEGMELFLKLVAQAFSL